MVLERRKEGVGGSVSSFFFFLGDDLREEKERGGRNIL